MEGRKTRTRGGTQVGLLGAGGGSPEQRPQAREGVQESLSERQGSLADAGFAIALWTRLSLLSFFLQWLKSDVVQRNAVLRFAEC